MNRLPRIFIVEDERITAEDLRAMLSSLGYAVTGIVSNGSDALKEVSLRPPDLILMDIILRGDIDGIQTCLNIQAIADIPVVYVTAHSDTETLRRAQATEPFGYIIKPFDRQEIRSTIDLALHKHSLELQLKRNQALLNTTLSGIGDAVVSTDAEGKITFMNPAAERMAHLSAGEAAGTPFHQTFHLIIGKTKRRAANPVTALLQGAVASYSRDDLLLKSDTAGIAVSVTGSPVNADGKNITGTVITLRDESEKRAAHKGLEDAAGHWQTTFDSINDGICMLTLDGTIMKCNRAIEHLSGMPTDDIIGSNCGTTICRGALGSNACLLEQMKKSRVRESRVLRIKGSWYRAFIDPVFDSRNRLTGAIHTFSDITPMKTVEDALRAGEEKYRELVENANSIILRRTPEGIITFFNEYAQRFFGFGSTEIFGKNVLGTIIPHTASDGTDTAELVAAIGTDPDAFSQNENENVKKDGTRVWVSWTNRAIRNADGVITGVLCIGNDITERRRIEKEQRLMEQQLLQAQKMEAVGILAGGVAHDFNNLLTAIQGHNDLAMSKLGDSHPVFRFLQQVHLAAARSFDLTSQLLLFSRKSKLESKPVDVNDIITGLQKMLRRLIGENFTIRLKQTPELWPVFADRGSMEQVLMNLTLNARDAMPDGGEITISTENCLIDAEYCTRHSEAQEGRYICISVTDTGTGMDEATRRRIFEPFYTTKPQGKGTGLGLSVAYGIVHQHQGWFTVTSEPGNGTAFNFLIPAMESTVIPEVAPLVPADKGTVGKGERILVVEDSKGILDFTYQALKDHGYEVFTAQTGAEARHLAGREKYRFHMVLADVVLPDTNGVEVVDGLLEHNPDLRTAFMSGYTDEQSRREIIQKRRSAFMQKPFNLLNLLKLVEDVLS